MLPNVSQSPTDPAFVANPYGFYDRIRPHGDLVFWSDYDMPMAVSHRAVSALLRDRRLGREAPDGKTPPPPDRLRQFYGLEANSMLELDGARHARLRKLVLHAFTSRNVTALVPRIRQLCHDLIDRLPPGSFDLLATYANQVPVITIARLLGLPEEDCDQLLDWSHAMVAMYQAGRSRADEDRAEAASIDFAAYLLPHIDMRRRTPRQDLLSQLVAAEMQGDRMTSAELISTTILLLNAGHEATVHTLANGIAACIIHDVSPTPDTAQAVVEEVLRFDPPLHLFTRWVYEPCTLFDHAFQPGDQVGLLLGAAGRDPAVFETPNSFDPSRPILPHVAFGAGPHFCVGAPLARLEMAVALEVLFSRCPALSLDAPPKYADIFHFHGLERLVCRR